MQKLKLRGRPEVVLIAAVARNRVVGAACQLPWTLPGDLARFKTMTSGKAVVMGRKTWDSLPDGLRPLPERRNYVLTRQTEWAAQGAVAVATLDDVLEAELDSEEVFVIGGGEVYALAMPLTNRIEMTQIRADVVGDAVFPDYEADWCVAKGHRSDVEGRLTDGQPVTFDYVTLRRR